MLIEIDKDIYDAIEEQYDCGIEKHWDDNWEMHYYCEEAILDMYEGNILQIVEQEIEW